MKKSVLWSVFPRFDQGASLRSEGGFGDENTLRPCRGPRGIEHHAGPFGVAIVHDGNVIEDGVVLAKSKVLGQFEGLEGGLEGGVCVGRRFGPWRQEYLFCLGRKLGRMEQQGSLGLCEDVLQFGRREWRREGQCDCAQGEDSEECYCSA